MQWLQVQALMRLAACYFAQNKRSQAKEALHRVQALNIRGNHDYTMRVELQGYPALQSLLEERGEVGELIVKQSAVERLRISALGEPTVFIDGAPITCWRMARAMELYFFLLENRQPLRKDQIIETLWPDAEDIERVNQTFRSTLYYLRQTIGESSLVHQAGLYHLDLSAYSPFWYDVDLFEEQENIAQAALEEKDGKIAEQAFQRMVDLYKGDYVQSFYSDWCIPRREDLRISVIDAHRELARIAWREADWDKCLQHWQRVLSLDSCVEAAYYGVMRCYQQLGKREMALQQYKRCCKVLREQLGVKPRASLQKLYQTLSA